MDCGVTQNILTKSIEKKSITRKANQKQMRQSFNDDNDDERLKESLFGSQKISQLITNQNTQNYHIWHMGFQELQGISSVIFLGNTGSWL